LIGRHGYILTLEIGVLKSLNLGSSLPDLADFK
jgi:hypothetical protein